SDERSRNHGIGCRRCLKENSVARHCGGKHQQEGQSLTKSFSQIVVPRSLSDASQQRRMQFFLTAEEDRFAQKKLAPSAHHSISPVVRVPAAPSWMRSRKPIPGTRRRI